ncbi:hypothetical protein AKJ13_04465 [Methylobacterium sp. ARG-1]|nr:hypothetical protein AKJ13_04465 [Methylobacterium sp. ARG-1]
MPAVFLALPNRGVAFGTFGPLFALTQAPMQAWHARLHRADAHRYTALSRITGLSCIAGFFTFPFGRMLGRWLFA